MRQTILVAALVGALLPAQESAQLIAAPEVVGTSADSFRVAPDLNGDGDKDAVSVWFGSSGMRVAGWWNDGAGVLTPGWSGTFPLANLPVGPLGQVQATVDFGVGDLNGDGAEDFAFALHTSVGWWISNGDLVLPDVPWVVVMPLAVVDIAVADFDVDGRADVAILTSSELRIYLSQAAGPPLLASTLALLANDGLELCSGYLDPGSTPDLGLLRIGNVDVISVVVGVMQAPTTIALPLPAESALVAGDVDGDGDDDLVAAANVGPNILVTVIRRTGPASFTPDLVQSFPQNSVVALPRALVDADGDGDLDLLAVTGSQGPSGTGGAPNVASKTAVLRRNSGGGTFSAAEVWSIVGGTTDFAVVDLDADGDLDFLAGRCVTFGRPGRGFAFDVTPTAANGFAPLGDVDGDGDSDLTPGIAGASVFQPIAVPGTAVSDGSGVYTSASSVAPPAPAGTSFVGPGFPGDFDGDGDLDLVVEHINGTTPSPSAGFAMRLLRNLGGGAFADGGPAAATSMRAVTTNAFSGSSIIDVIDHRSVLVADVDGDADVDLVALYPVAGHFPSPAMGARLWVNDGTGAFTAGQGLPGMRPCAAGDMTGDGVPDLLALEIVAVMGSGFLVLLPGLGGASFGPPVVIVGPIQNNYVLSLPALADVDGDGDLDVAFVENGVLTTHLNDGFGNFVPVVVGQFESPVFGAVRVGDVDGDGHLDLVASTATLSFAVRIWLRDPVTPGWIATRTWSTTLGALDDVDADGDLDLLTTGTDRGFIHHNRTFSPPTNAVRKQYGAGLAGSGGLVPLLGSAGVARVGSSGSIRVSNALGGASMLFGAGTAQIAAPILGGTLLMSPDLIIPFTLGGAPGVAGAGFLEVPFTIPPGLAGFQAFEQAAIQDPGAPQGWALTQGLRIVIGY